MWLAGRALWAGRARSALMLAATATTTAAAAAAAAAADTAAASKPRAPTLGRAAALGAGDEPRRRAERMPMRVRSTDNEVVSGARAAAQSSAGSRARASQSQSPSPMRPPRATNEASRVERMHHDGELSVREFNSTLAKAAREGDAATVERLLHDADRLRYPRDLLTAALTMSYMNSAGRFVDASTLFAAHEREMRARVSSDHGPHTAGAGGDAGAAADSTSRSAEAGDGVRRRLLAEQLRALAGLGKPEEAVALFERMEREGDAVTRNEFNHVVLAFCKVGRLGEARALLNKWATERRADLALSPFDTLIGAYAQQGDFAAVADVLAQMSLLNLNPSSRTVALMVRGLVKAGLLKRAEEYLDVFRGTQASPTVVAYTNIMAGYVHAGEAERAAELFDRMVERDGVSPNDVSYCVLVRALCQLGRHDDALARFREQCDVTGDVHLETSTLLIRALAQAGRLRDAHLVFSQLRSARRADAFAYTQMALCAANAGNVQLAGTVLSALSEDGVRAPAEDVRAVQAAILRRAGARSNAAPTPQ